MSEAIFEIERMLLATMMLRPSDCWRVDVAPEYFASEQHADVLRAIRQLSQDSLPVDPVSVADYFEQQGKRALSGLALQIGNSNTTAIPEAHGLRIVAGWRQRRARDIGAGLMQAKTDDAVDAAIADLMALHATEQKHEFSAKEAARAAVNEIAEIHKHAGRLPGVTTGLVDLDSKLGGLHRSDLIVVGGRAAMGKTALLISMAKAAAVAGHPVGIISGEQPVEQMALRMVASGANLSAQKFRTANFEDHEWARVTNATSDIAGLPIWILDRSAPTIGEVIRVARRWKHRHGIKALYVDYLQRIKGEGERKFEQVGMVVHAMKNLARDLDIPVLALSQVRRDVENRKSNIPHMGDLSDSSEIEKEADQVILIYREAYYDEEANPNVARLIIDKNRHGPTGWFDVAWRAETMQFADLDRSAA